MMEITPLKEFDFSTKIYIMGILNVTPDSFSDGGKFVSSSAIIAHVTAMIAEGVDIIDVGGESTRPSSEPVSEKEEINRVIPAIKAIRQNFNIPISIDTTKSEVASQAIKAGASMVNDVSALRFDSRMLSIVRETKVPVIIMHMQGSPKDMQLSPTYVDVIKETCDFFKERITFLVDNGISQEKIIIDPGLGFGKSIDHNLSIIKHLKDYKALGCPILIGHSRKSMFGTLLDNKNIDRDQATAAMTAIIAMEGASIVRVHNVAINRQAIIMAQAILSAS